MDIEMEGEEFEEKTEEFLIPNGFFEEEENVRKEFDLLYGGRTVQNEMKYTKEEVGFS